MADLGKALAIANFSQNQRLREAQIQSLTRNQARQDQAVLDEANNKVRDDLIKSATDIVQQGLIDIPAGMSLDDRRLQVLRAINPIKQSFIATVASRAATRFGATAQTVNQEVKDQLARFESLVTSAATPRERGAGTARESVAQAVGVSEGLQEAGVERATTEATAQAAGILPPEEAVTIRQIADEEGNKDLIVLDSQGNEIRRIEGGPDVELTGEFTKTAQTGAQQRVLRTTELLRNTATLSSLLEEGTVGMIPAFRGFLNTTVAQFAPEVFDQDRAEFERFTKLTRQAALRVVSDESRFSEADRDFIFELFPATGPFESDENARTKLQVMQAFFLKRLEPDILASGLDPKSFDTGLRPDAVKEAFEKGFFSEDQAARILELIWPELFGSESKGASGGAPTNRF